jgi:hypothetical protein
MQRAGGSFIVDTTQLYNTYDIRRTCLTCDTRRTCSLLYAGCQVHAAATLPVELPVTPAVLLWAQDPGGLHRRLARILVACKQVTHVLGSCWQLLPSVAMAWHMQMHSFYTVG